jgi:hypothetical protein
MEHSVRKLVKPSEYDFRREVIIDEQNGKVYRDEWDGMIVSHEPMGHNRIDRIPRKPYIK